jgi:hypothetical protein
MQEHAEGLALVDESHSASVEPETRVAATTIAGSKQWASKVRKRAKELAETLDLGYMELARILYQVFDTPVEGDPRRGAIYTAWGYNNFGEYAERELGLHQRKAERLRLIWYVLEVQLAGMDSGLKERVVALGYSKVRELVRVLTLRNAETWVQQSEGMTYRQLIGAVRDEKRRQGVDEAVLGAGEAGDPILEDGEASAEPIVPPAEVKESLTQERFDLYPLQLANVRLALQRSMEVGRTEKKGHALDLICTDFLATNDVMGGDLDKRLRYLAKIERILGFRLIAVDPELKDIVYGIDALKLVADS